jgi:hypothetical protein
MQGGTRNLVIVTGVLCQETSGLKAPDAARPHWAAASHKRYKKISRWRSELTIR